MGGQIQIRGFAGAGCAVREGTGLIIQLFSMCLYSGETHKDGCIQFTTSCCVRHGRCALIVHGIREIDEPAHCMQSESVAPWATSSLCIRRPVTGICLEAWDLLSVDP